MDIGYLLSWDRMLAFSRTRPVLDTLITIPGIFVAFVCLLPLPVTICVVIAVDVALCVAVSRGVVERRQGFTSSQRS